MCSSDRHIPLNLRLTYTSSSLQNCSFLLSLLYLGCDFHLMMSSLILTGFFVFAHTLFGDFPFLLNTQRFWGLPLSINDFYKYFQGIPWLRIRFWGFPLNNFYIGLEGLPAFFTHTLFVDSSVLFSFQYAFGDFPFLLTITSIHFQGLPCLCILFGTSHFYQTFNN